MFRKLRNVKLIAALSALVAMFAVAPVVHGGILWTGIDPIVKTRESLVNIWAEWPAGNECAITGPITFKVEADRGQLLSESARAFPCGDGAVMVQTKTTVQDARRGKLNVAEVFMPASSDFPVRARVYVDGELKLTCEGVSNSPFTCGSVELDGTPAKGPGRIGPGREWSHP
ncbi:MAG: hypothetical protein L0177_12140 [Chloroflexi bacterium]|nr:hypothetical protein [Chloroflexota bacterium]